MKYLYPKESLVSSTYTGNRKNMIYEEETYYLVAMNTYISILEARSAHIDVYINIYMYIYIYI